MDTSQPPTPQNAADAPLDDPETRASIAAGHETRDVSVKGLFVFTAALFLFLVPVAIGTWVFFKASDFVDTRIDAANASREPAAQSQVRARPEYRGPLLQVKPEEDLRWMRDHDNAALGGYGWIDRQAGIVRLPIERAMDLVAQRGLAPVSPGKTLEALQRERAQPQVFGQSLRP